MPISDASPSSAGEVAVNRPWLQRNELGLLVHEIGHDIYDQAETQGQADGLPTRQDESLIAHGSRLVSTILAATVRVEQ